MRKFTSIIIILTLLLSCFNINVFAAQLQNDVSTDQNQNNMINNLLEEQNDEPAVPNENSDPENDNGEDQPDPDVPDVTDNPDNPDEPDEPDDPVVIPDPCERFTDIDRNAWYHSSIDYAIEKGLFAGVSENRFSPDSNMTRAMLVTVLFRFMQSPEPHWDNRFKDIEPDKWYTDATLWANENGFITGTSSDYFTPDADITREQAVTILYRFASSQAFDLSSDNDLTQYEDKNEISGYAMAAMSWAVTHGIINGTSQTRISPSGKATRAQIAAMLMRFIPQMEASRPGHEHEFHSDETTSRIRTRLTCTTDETYWWVCDCGVRSTSEFDTYEQAPGHEWYRQVKEPTCVEFGYQRETCTRCGYSMELAIKPLGHSYIKETVNPTDDKEGYDLFTCQTCGYQYKDNIIPPLDPIPNVENAIVSKKNMREAVNKYNETHSDKITNTSDAIKALISINTVYKNKLTSSQKNKPMVFVFEGCGADLDPNKRMDAMAVVVKNGKIVYINRYSTTVPDWPFKPYMNDDGQAMPLIKSGIYNCEPTNHPSKSGNYAAWHVYNCRVVRFNSRTSYFSSTSTGINVHRRTQDTIVKDGNSWVNSCGCILIGKSGLSSSGDYAGFIAAVGLVGAGSRGSAPYQNYISGTLIIDRAYGRAYLKAVGYPDEAIDLLEH